MKEGLFWLVLLLVFTLLAWAGRREFQKVEAYRQWSGSFTNAKYDIYSVLGIKDNTLVYGKPTNKGIIEEKSISIDRISSVTLEQKKKPTLIFSLKDCQDKITIPFTEINLAQQWERFISELLVEVKNDLPK
jgi:hypothetical protein